MNKKPKKTAAVVLAAFAHNDIFTCTTTDKPKGDDIYDITTDYMREKENPVKQPENEHYLTGKQLRNQRRKNMREQAKKK